MEGLLMIAALKALGGMVGTIVTKAIYSDYNEGKKKKK